MKKAPAASRRPWLLGGLAALAAALFAVFLWIALEAGAGSSLAAWDGGVTDAFVGARSAGWDRLFWSFTLVGNSPVMAALTVMTVVLLLAWGRWARAVLVAGALASAEATSDLVKAVVQRPRPPEAIALIGPPGSPSLPSGHAFLTLVFLGLLVFLAFRLGARRPGGARGGARVGPRLPSGERRPGGTRGARRRVLLTLIAIVAAGVVILVGLSRVYLGVHWTSDILAGWCLGGAWLAVALGLFTAWERSGRPLRDGQPWRGRASRTALTVGLALAAAGTVILAAWTEPLLTSLLP